MQKRIVTVRRALIEAIGIPPEQITAEDEARAAKILIALGRVRRWIWWKGQYVEAWLTPEEDAEQEALNRLTRK